MKHPKLPVQKREIFGKNLKKIRREGFVPANIYGKDIKSEAVQVASKDFEKLYKEVGETGLVDVEVDGQARPVLIKNVQINPLTHVYLHADLHQVNLKEKIKAMVPVVPVGEPKAVSEKIGLLLQPLSEVEVEALPEDLPENIEVNVEPLAAIDESLTVADLKKPGNVEILTEPTQVVVKITELVSEEAKAQAEADAAAAEAAKAESAAPVEGAEGAPAEGATPAETPTSTEEKPKE